ncbi:hypothetical protein DFQ26_004192 [Actinomortierella ambigua]|nr:hypothetical protein DFQ26_004192 [Actinomortierella ambigua]
MELDADHIELPNMMQLSVDRQIQQGDSEAMVLGILVQSWMALLYYICLEHEAICEIRSIGQFDPIVERMQLCKLLKKCPILLEAKCILEALTTAALQGAVHKTII